MTCTCFLLENNLHGQDSNFFVLIMASSSCTCPNFHSLKTIFRSERQFFSSLVLFIASQCTLYTASRYHCHFSWLQGTGNITIEAYRHIVIQAQNYKHHHSAFVFQMISKIWTKFGKEQIPSCKNPINRSCDLFGFLFSHFMMLFMIIE